MAGNGILIGRCRPGDLHALGQLDVRTPAGLRSDVERSQEPGAAKVILVARLDGRVVGATCVGMAAGNSAVQHWVAVHEDYRHKGVATALLDAALMHCRHRFGADKMHATVANDPDAVRIYSERGFTARREPTGERGSVFLEKRFGG